MTTIIQTDGDFSAVASGLILPVDGPANWHILGGALASSLRNLGDPTKAATAVGAPNVQPSYLSMDNNGNYLETGTADASGLTLFAVARAPAATQSARAISNATSTGGVSLYMSTTNAVTVSAFYSDTGSTAQITSAAIANRTAWRLLVARFDASGQTVWDKTGGGTATLAKASPRVLATGTFRLGSRIPANTGSEIDMAFGAIYRRALSNQDIDALCAFIRSEMAYQPDPITV